MNNFPRYESYKDSGVDWLGEIPSHWEVVRSKRLFQQRTERARKDDEQLTASQRFGVIFQEEFMELEGRRVTQVEFNRNILKHIEPNDFLISMRSFQGGIEFSRYKGCVSSAYVVLTPVNHIVPEFYQYLLKSDGYIRALSSTSNLVRDGQALRFENFSLVDLIIIPKEEQTIIARFLDRKLPQIDQAIAQKEKLIELLQERRQILINNAVTRGLNPNVKMKYSGVDWIGEIPEHWEVSKLGYITEEIGDGLHGTPEYIDDSEYNFINGNNLVNGEIKFTEQTKKVSFKEFLKYKTPLNDKTMLLSINGTIGNLAFYKGEKVMLGKSAAYINFVSGSNIEFAYYFLGCYANKIYFDRELSGSTINNLSLYSIKKTLFLIPSKNEQKLIVLHLFNICNKIEVAISCKQKEIEKLKEYKAVLINSAVTGKIKVSDNN